MSTSTEARCTKDELAAAGRCRHPAGLVREPRHRPADHRRRLSRHRSHASYCTPRTACSAWVPPPLGDEIDPDLINAGKIPVTELPGASYFHHADSFAMMRGGHLDVCVLGAFQVSAGRRPGQLAHRRAGRDSRSGRGDGSRHRRQVGVRHDELFAKDRTAKLVPRCSYPLTGVGCVGRIYTDCATIMITSDGVVVTETFGASVADLQDRMEVSLRAPGQASSGS